MTRSVDTDKSWTQVIESRNRLKKDFNAKIDIAEDLVTASVKSSHAERKAREALAVAKYWYNEALQQETFNMF